MPKLTLEERIAKLAENTCSQCGEGFLLPERHATHEAACDGTVSRRAERQVFRATLIGMTDEQKTAARATMRAERQAARDVKRAERQAAREAAIAAANP